MPTAKAGAQCQVPVPSRPPRHGAKWGWQGQARPTGASKANSGKQGQQGQAGPMGASKTGVGRRDRWGQASLVGAGEANGGHKPPGQIPSQHLIRAKVGSLQCCVVSGKTGPMATVRVSCGITHCNGSVLVPTLTRNRLSSLEPLLTPNTTHMPPDFHYFILPIPHQL